MSLSEKQDIKIVVIYLAVDGFRDRRHFKTLRGAQRYAQSMIGAHPEMGARYAISGDGIGRVTVAGDACLHELFPEDAPLASAIFDDEDAEYYPAGQPIEPASGDLSTCPF